MSFIKLHVHSVHCRCFYCGCVWAKLTDVQEWLVGGNHKENNTNDSDRKGSGESSPKAKCKRGGNHHEHHFKRSIIATNQIMMLLGTIVPAAAG
jgi:hypothetical protein